MSGKIYDHSKKSLSEACGISKEELDLASEKMRNVFSSQKKASEYVEGMEKSGITMRELCLSHTKLLLHIAEQGHNISEEEKLLRELERLSKSN